ncbi:hypothetical protein PGTUg99_003508 [Puccinia graminis f. sp. tritici]|uniref:Uncharacterized protein n=1 Tax=Puccinia graminis f. sp. tritici TaxID=56615 RepID=A0A5B0RM82_PUCGR|nr:hypothetical protein PGTUg99_003508 [Puccinia graminis f. sp. tritici]
MPVIQPLDSISIDSAQCKTQEKEALIQQLLSSQNHLSLFTESRNIWTLLLKRYHRKFVHVVLSIQFDNQPVSPQIETQHDLSFVMWVMQGSNSLIKLANPLVLKTIHKLHEIILNKLDISSFNNWKKCLSATLHPKAQQSMTKFATFFVQKHCCNVYSGWYKEL